MKKRLALLTVLIFGLSVVLISSRIVRLKETSVFSPPRKVVPDRNE